MRRSLLVTAALAAALSAAACDSTGTPSGSSGGTGTSTTGPATTGTTTGSPAPGDSVAWMDKVCSEVFRLSDVVTNAPPDLGNSDAGQALKAFDEYMAKNIENVDRSIDGIESVGASPIEGGDQAMTALVNGMEAMKKSYQTVRDRFASVNPNDPQTAQTALADVFNALGQGAQELGTAMESIQNNQELKAAYDQAPNCQKLNGDPEPTTTTS